MSSSDLAAFTKRRDETTRRQGEAADPLRSAWVSANAGTGKTKVLTDRVIRLLLKGAEPEKILCLTFTKTAAAEMANRLFENLGRWTTLEDEELLKELTELGAEVEVADLDPARRLFARALETPGGLKIQTIHAFCQSLLERFPLESGIRPGSEVLDDRSALGLYREAELSLHRSPREDLKAALEHLAILHDGPRFSDLLRKILGKRKVLTEMIEEAGGLEGLRPHVAGRLDLAEDATPRSLADEELADFEALETEILGALEALSTGTKTDKDRADKISVALTLGGVDGAQTYKSAILKADGTSYARLYTKGVGTGFPAVADFLEGERERLESLESQRRKVNALQYTLDVLVLGDAYIGAYDAQKSAHGFLDYDDLIAKTGDLLGLPGVSAWVHFKLDGGLLHILVDEAQDTSPGQWEVVQSLAEEFFTGQSAHEDGGKNPRTIFAVGDEKQSIYSFQGAEPERFGEMRAFFAEKVRSAGQAFSDLELILSFRSTSEVLGAVDAVFANPAAAKGLSSLGAVPTHEADRFEVPGLVEIWPTAKPGEKLEIDPWDAPLDRPPANAPRAVVATEIADQIARWLETKEPVYEGGPAIKPGDILILVQRRNSFVDEMIRALKKKDIPVAGRDRMVLTDQMAVMDLMALAQFALLPEDDLTLATVLRSPIVGLSEEDLFDLAHHRGKGERLWQALMLRQEEARFADGWAELSSVLARVDLLRPYEFFAAALGPGVVYEKSGRERLLHRLGPEAGDPIDEFLSHALQFEQTMVPSLESFLSEMRRGHAEVKRDFDADPREVRIMTVHGAKGLEGPIVFLPDTCALPTAQNEGPILELGGEGQPFLFYGLARSDSDRETNTERDNLREKRLQEQRRLLYVAMTRAKDRLYIAGYETTRKRPDGCWYSLIEEALSPMMKAAMRFDGTEILQLSHTHAEKPGKEDEKKKDAAVVSSGDVSLPSWVDVPVGIEPPPRRFAPSSLQTAVLGEETTHFEGPASHLSAVIRRIALNVDWRYTDYWSFFQMFRQICEEQRLRNTWRHRLETLRLILARH